MVQKYACERENKLGVSGLCDFSRTQVGAIFMANSTENRAIVPSICRDRLKRCIQNGGDQSKKDSRPPLSYVHARPHTLSIIFEFNETNWI